MTDKIRLQKFFSQQGICSRRDAEDFIRKRQIRVDGTIAELGDRVSGEETILLLGKPIKTTKTPRIIYLKFNKPIGVESTLRKFSNHASLASFDFGSHRVFPVGRLDKNSRGLMLLTNDGELTHQLMHPKFEHEKEYEVQVTPAIRPGDLEKMEKGIHIEDGLTRPCRITKINDKQFRITLREGKKRQIRYMCEALGYEVTDLLRIRIENIKLLDLAPGKVSHLTEAEIKALPSLKK